MRQIKFFIPILAVTASLYAQRLPHIDSLQANFRVEPCCATTLDKCAREKPNCAIAPRLKSFLTWMDSTKRHSDERMTEQLVERYTMFAAGPKHPLNHAGWPVVGDPKAPLTVTVYFAATCPMCKTHFKMLHETVTTGALNGKVKMVWKPSAPSPTNTILMAAHQMGRFSDFMLALNTKTGRVDDALMYSVAGELKLDTNALRKMSEDPMLKKRMEEASAEATKVDVRYTPFYMINGKRYNSVLDMRWVVDAIEYELEAMKK